MKRISHRTYAACNETRESSCANQIRGRSSSHRKDSNRERYYSDDGNREQALEPLIAEDHSIPVRAWRHTETNCAEQRDCGKRHRNDERRYSAVRARTGEPCEITLRHANHRKREYKLQQQKANRVGG